MEAAPFDIGVGPDLGSPYITLLHSYCFLRFFSGHMPCIVFILKKAQGLGGQVGVMMGEVA